MADELVVRLSGVVGCPGAIEVLEALADGARSQAEICDAARVSGRRLERVLRTLAAEGVVSRCDEPGSWDLRPGPEIRHMLTELGEELMVALSDVGVWVTIYEDYLYGG